MGARAGGVIRYFSLLITGGELEHSLILIVSRAFGPPRSNDQFVIEYIHRGAARRRKCGAARPADLVIAGVKFYSVYAV